jgi:hypothetical protein
MEAAAVFAPLRKLRDELRGEVAKLEERCRELEAAMATAGEEANRANREHRGDLAAVGVEVETTRRMLGLVEATVQQVAAHGQAALCTRAGHCTCHKRRALR